MGKFKLFTHSIILATTPTFLIYPQGALRQADFHVQAIHSKKLQKNFRKKERYHLVSYDDMLTLLEEIESGKFDHETLKAAVKPSLAMKLRVGLLLHGVDIQPWPGAPVSAVHTADDMQRTVDAFRQTIRMLQSEHEI